MNGLRIDGMAGGAVSFAAVMASAVMLLLASAVASAQSKDLGGGFRDHGVVTPISSHRGIVATVDGDGRNVVLVWLMDHRGGYALLMIDAETGKAEQFPMPYSVSTVDSPFSSILSSENKFYTHFNSHFVEFDPVKRAFTFSQKTTPQMAMGMTEDDAGVIWSATYPQSGVVSFNPKTRELRDYGHVYKQNWPQYQRHVAADDTGWIYFAVGMTATQLIIFDPKTGEATPVLSEDQRGKGTAYVYRSLDGKVYGQSVRGGKDNWYELYNGQAKFIESHEKAQPKAIITSDQSLFHRTFPDGSTVKECNLIDRRLVVVDADSKQEKEVSFDYSSEGAHIMALAAAPDGTICGGTAFPMRFFSYNPEKDELVNRPGVWQWNTVARQGDRFFVGAYSGGHLLEWDPSKPWVNIERGNADSNPLYLAEANPTINRPHELLAYPDGKTIVMGGTPAYGYTGGGLLFWDRESRSETLLTDQDLIPLHSTMSMAALPEGKLLGGTTTAAGTGGERKANEAQLYILDLASKKVEWQEAVFPGVQEYTDLFVAPGGLIYGIADRKLFFVFDGAQRKVVHKQEVDSAFGPIAYQQGPRIFIAAPNDRVFMLFSKGIVEVDAKDYAIRMFAQSPISIGGGGDYLEGRVYFMHGSHLYSYQMP